MTDIVQALKTRARILQKQIIGGEVGALAKARKLGELRTFDDQAIASSIKRRHCLALVARECGFDGWSHFVAVIVHNDRAKGMGTLLHPGRCQVHWNIWFADYDHASRVRQEHGGFLLGYKNQFLVVDEDYIKSLGFQPDDNDVVSAGRDWINPEDNKARLRLFARLIQRIHADNPLFRPDADAA